MARLGVVYTPTIGNNSESTELYTHFSLRGDLRTSSQYSMASGTADELFDAKE